MPTGRKRRARTSAEGKRSESNDSLEFSDWAGLPDECLECIFTRLDHESLATCAEVGQLSMLTLNFLNEETLVPTSLIPTTLLKIRRFARDGSASCGKARRFGWQLVNAYLGEIQR